MPSDDSFEHWLGRLKTGDAEAAEVIFERHVSQLVALARSRLDRRVRVKVDPEDVVQSAFRSFFKRFSDGRFEFAKWDDLWTMLAVITLRKCGHQVEYYRAACRDVRKESAAMPSTADSIGSWQAIARDPTPSDALKLSETIEQLLEGLKELEQQILLLKLAGHSTAEIGERVNRTDRTVRLVLERIKRRLESLRDN